MISLLPVSGVCDSEEYSVEEATELSLKSLADVVLLLLRFLRGLRGRLGLHTEQETEEGR